MRVLISVASVLSFGLASAPSRNVNRPRLALLLHSGGRQIEDAVGRALDQPFERFMFLADADLQQGMFERVGVLASRRLKKVPRLDSKAPIDRNVQRPDLVTDGWRGRGFWIRAC